MKAGVQMVSQTYLFSFHHSPHSPTSRPKARLKLFFVICIWWLSLAKGCHSDCCQSGGEEERSKTRGRKAWRRQGEPLLRTRKLGDGLCSKGQKKKDQEVRLAAKSSTGTV